MAGPASRDTTDRAARAGWRASMRPEFLKSLKGFASLALEEKEIGEWSGRRRAPVISKRRHETNAVGWSRDSIDDCDASAEIAVGAIPQFREARDVVWSGVHVDLSRVMNSKSFVCCGAGMMGGRTTERTVGCLLRFQQPHGVVRKDILVDLSGVMNSRWFDGFGARVPSLLTTPVGVGRARTTPPKSVGARDCRGRESDKMEQR